MRIEATHRVQLVFSLLDADGNGVLEARDFDLMAGRVVAAGPRLRRGGARRDARRLPAVLDHPRRRARRRRRRPDHLRGVHRLRTLPERFDATVDAFARALAALGDPAGEGQVARPAFVALMTAIGFGRANIDALFDAFGPTPEDRIAVATWVEGIKDYYAPDKAGIPGDHLVDTAAV